MSTENTQDEKSNDLIKKGYQPSTPIPPIPDPDIQSGYQPASQGENPLNKPTPPKSE